MVSACVRVCLCVFVWMWCCGPLVLLPLLSFFNPEGLPVLSHFALSEAAHRLCVRCCVALCLCVRGNTGKSDLAPE